ncbi:MAG: hypothetical protein JNM78_17425 [Cyclobacteriaceae bacterium]|nr:hypothetical protein [Cyclobacteriaceae bacterium]
MNKKGSSVVIANNDVVYLWWSVPRKIKDCLGFSIHRVVNQVEDPKGLYATVGFGVKTDKRKSPQTTDEWPIQSFNWKDLYAPSDKELQYRIYPMIGKWDNLKLDKKHVIITDTANKTQKFGDVKIIFNRGILSTQAFSKSGNGKPVTPDSARKLITNPTSVWRKRLAGQMLYNFTKFFDRAVAEGGGRYYAALYELSDKGLIDQLIRNKNTQVILSNTGTDDKTNKAARKQLHAEPNITIYDRMLGSHIGHNKFVIYADRFGVPKAVLTGSTNWTPTGLCGQTNNLVIIESEPLAQAYKEYWDKLKADIPDKQGEVLRTWCKDNSFQVKANQNKTDLKVWFSPNTKQKTKPAKNPSTPVDMKEVFDRIGKAKESVLFLLFNPGKPSIVDEIKTIAAKRPANKPLFVRGAISDAATARQATTNIFSTDILARPDTYYEARITGVAAIPGPFSYFEAELLKIGFATIHDKIVVIDPFGTNPIVITGSHNLGYAASYKNDENMVIIEDKAIAAAYTAHVLDVVNHFKWRYKLQKKVIDAKAKTLAEKKKALQKGWNDLDEYDKWMNYYFNTNGFINRDKFILK